MTSDVLDARFYEAAPPRSLGERLTVAARERIYGDFLRYARPCPDETILDVGVSDVVNAAANVLERRYPDPGRITAAGLGAATAFREAYPDVAYRQIVAGEALPFTDGAFAVATSNAVLEHVGSISAQAFHVAELARVSRRAFISVPNRFFPVEHHTGIPLLHYNDRAFAFACHLLSKGAWADRRNLILMSARRLGALAPAERRITIGSTGLRLGPFSSNLFMMIDEI